MRIFSFLAVIILLTGMATASDWKIEQFENGLKVMILENHQVPQVNISTTVKVGGKNETDFFHGATHLLEHLILFRGTEKLTGEELGDAMKAHGAYFNGYTSSDWTDFIISLPKENLDYALQIHADMLFRSNFPAEEMDKERQAVYEEINISEDNPSSRLYYSSLASLYGEHPYAGGVLGTQENVLNIPRDSVYAYYKRYYAPNNMTMVIVGDIKADETMALVKKYFADFPRGEEARDRYQPPPIRKAVEEIVIEKDVNQAYLMMSTIGPMSDSPDQFPLDLMANILGSGESSRLYKKLQDELGLVYSIGFSFYTNKYEGIVLSTATMDPANLAQVEQVINELISEAKETGFTEQELQKAKNQIKTGYFTGMQRGLNVADNYAQYDSHVGYQFIRDYPDSIEKVTLAQLNAAAQKYLNTDSYVKTTVVPK